MCFNNQNLPIASAIIANCSQLSTAYHLRIGAIPPLPINEHPVLVDRGRQGTERC